MSNEPTDFGMHGLCPHLVCRDAAKAMDFHKQAFGAEELMRLPGPDGRLMHGTLKINGCMVMYADEYDEVPKDHRTTSPQTLGGTSVSLHMVVDDCDAWVARAEKAGCIIVLPPADMFWGDRYAQVACPWGHRWSIATPKGTPVMGDELVSAMNDAMERAKQ
jgi:PhnB protein